MFDLHDKIAIVTGASQGIGKTIALELSKSGAFVYCISRNKKAIETASSNLRNSLKGTDIEDIKKNTQDLVQASMKLGEAIYKSQQSGKPGDAPKDAKEEGKKDENVVDADFEEVKDENKEKSA